MPFVNYLLNGRCLPVFLSGDLPIPDPSIAKTIGGNRDNRRVIGTIGSD